MKFFNYKHLAAVSGVTMTILLSGCSSVPTHPIAQQIDQELHHNLRGLGRSIASRGYNSRQGYYQKTYQNSGIETQFGRALGKFNQTRDPKFLLGIRQR